MAIFNPTPAVLEKDVQALSEVIFASAFRNANVPVSRLHAIFTGIECNKRIQLIGNRASGRAMTGDCSFPTGTSYPTSTKTWTPISVADELAICSDELKCSMDYMMNNYRTTLEKYNLEGSETAQFLAVKTAEEILDAVYRISAFGDTGYVNPAGNTFDGTLVTGLNGYWKQIFDAVASVAIPANRVISITENAAGTYAAQVTLASDTAYNTLKSMYMAADSRLKNDSNAYFALTSEMFDNYLFYMQESTSGSAIAVEQLETGGRAITGVGAFMGIDVIERPDWSKTIYDSTFDGTVADMPNRALFVTPTTLSLGLLSEADLDSYEFFYDRKDNLNYNRWALQVDAKLLEEDYKIVVAY